MKISSFQPMNVYEAQQPRKTAEPKPDESSSVQKNAPEASSTAAQAEIISQEEKRYFAQLYPNDSQKITSYSTYSKNGVTKEFSVGSLIDKKS